MTAGTSDIPVAEEAALTAEAMGNRVKRVWDVGVAGIHRVLGGTVAAAECASGDSGCREWKARCRPWWVVW